MFGRKERKQLRFEIHTLFGLTRKIYDIVSKPNVQPEPMTTKPDRDVDLPVKKVVTDQGKPMVVASVKFYAEDYTKLKKWLNANHMSYAQIVRSALKEWFLSHGVETEG